MATATARVPVLMTQAEKERIVKKAMEAGLSTGEYMRRAADSFHPDEQNQLLEGLIDQMLQATDRAEQAIDDAIAFVEASNQRHGSRTGAGLMGVTEKMWDAVARVIRMDDKVERLAGTVKEQQMRIEGLTERVIRLETALEIALAGQGMKQLPP